MSQQDLALDRQFAEKQALKQQAKQMLLKQCYKMASNKYLRLIQMGSKGFTQRQWAVVHLNTAISMQFQNRYKQALQKVNESIKIDIKYEKAYYRRIQILDEMGEYQLILHKSIVPEFIKNVEIDNLVKELRQKYKQTIGLTQLRKQMEDKDFFDQIGNQRNQMQFVSDCLSNAFKRIKQSLQQECRKSEKDSSYRMPDMLSNTKQQIGSFYEFLNILSNQEILKIFLQNVYKLCLQYLFNKEPAFIFITQLLSQFWIKFSQLEQMKGEGLPKQVFGNQVLNKKDGQDFAAQLILYCPTVLYNYQLFIRLVKIGTAEAIESSEVSTKLSKLVHNNLVFVRKLTEFRNRGAKMNENLIKLIEEISLQDQKKKKEEKMFQLTKVINLFIQTSTQRQVQLKMIQKISQTQPFILEILQLEELLVSAYFSVTEARNYEAYIQELFVNQSIIKLYRTIYKLSKSIYKDKNNEQREAYAIQLLKIISKMLLKNDLTVVQAYISFTSIHCLQIRELIKLKQESSEQYRNLQEIVLKLIISSKTNSKIEKGETISILLINILSYLNPIFIAQAYSENKSRNSVELLKIFDQFTKVDEVYEKIKKNSEKAKRIELSIYLQLLTSLAVSNISFLKNILPSSKKISQIFFILFGHKEEKNNFIEALNTNRNAIKLLYVLVVDVHSQRQADYAEKMGVSREDIIKAKKLQGQSLDKDMLSFIQGMRNKLISEISSKEQSNRWDLCLNNIINLFNEFANSQSTVDQDMISGTLSKLAQRQVPKLLTPTIVNFMLSIFQKYKLQDQNSPKGKVCYKSCRYFSSVCKKLNVNIIQYHQLQPITDSLVYLIQKGKHELHIFQSYLSLINLSGKRINVDLSIIETGLMEENPYIVHGSLELLNNLLVNTDFTNGNFDKKYWERFKRIHEYSFKYYQYYKNIVQEFKKVNKVKSEVGTNNYSHPFKIYCTLISLLLVIQSVDEGSFQLAKDSKFFVEEIKYWTPVKQNLEFIQNNLGNIDLTLFKFVLHHAENKSLSKDWSLGFSQSLKILKQNDTEKWAKLQKYLK